MRHVTIVAYLALATVACLWVVAPPPPAALPTMAPVAGQARMAPPRVAQPAHSDDWLLWPIRPSVVEKVLDNSLPPLPPSSIEGIGAWMQMLSALLGAYPASAQGALTAAFPGLAE